MVEEVAANYSGYRSFKDLECWKACLEVRRWLASVVKSFPKEERYELVSQMKRASRSTTANIAEGYGRFHFQENIQFCRTSRGSLYELIDHLSVAVDEEYISQEKSDEGEALIRKSIAIINGYIKYLQNQKAR
ncbi:MAG: four helix bundle protein [Flavobacteriales bacterium]|nr:four helix bundle protein [Flavobacteriales bacterium]MCB9191812.1 four helix bundle protein [Flavobacteriales bacterium]